uniref:Uncharacterized protein n=1 Tax=Arundo donax TaxID=35708 RepID=A0A0A9B433_ARUDO
MLTSILFLELMKCGYKANEVQLQTTKTSALRLLLLGSKMLLAFLRFGCHLKKHT